jgi:AraC-like DNA-binding protein/uncharacterized RmlC-like cupin family protein
MARLEFETIQPTVGNSFRLYHATDEESCRVYWHHHPEYEIVYIPAGNGRRQIGQHLSRYEEGELVFIGPNIPHLNFAYGQSSDFEEYVIQMRGDFLGKEFLNNVEMEAVQLLFQKSKRGLAFGIHTKQKVGEKIRQMPHQMGFERMMTLLWVLQEMALATDDELLHSEDKSPDVPPKETERLRQIYAFVEMHFQTEIDVNEVAATVNLSLPAFCRYFKKMTRQTFTEFVNDYRINHARVMLLQNISVAEVAYECGFNNLSHFNRTFRKLTRQSPGEYRQQFSTTVYPLS